MIGIDTSFLVAFEIAEHTRHHAAREFATRRAGEGFALAPLVLAEFVHIVTDPRRFTAPVPMPAAISRARKWWQAGEVRVVTSGEAAGSEFLDMMSNHELGRKRVIDTLLAATYLANDVHTIVTLDARGFGLFPGFAPIPLR